MFFVGFVVFFAVDAVVLVGGCEEEGLVGIGDRGLVAVVVMRKKGSLLM